MKRWSFLALALLLAGAMAGGCSTLDSHQREWIFQPSDRSWGNSADLATDMDDVWIDYTPKGASAPVRLHGLWIGGEAPRSPTTPVLLYLHGARYNVAGSAPRMMRMHELGFAVLAVDYRGFGKSTKELPSEASAREDALAAWRWLAEHHPNQQRYIFGHSLGGAIGIDLASRVDDENGTIVEGTFSSIADVVSTFKWGWLPFRPLITQPFDSMARVKQIGSPLLVVHGSLDSLIRPELGRKLYEAAASPKLFVLVQGGSHFSTNSVGHDQYRAALTQLFQLQPATGADGSVQGSVGAARRS
jgi:pimeloyl-ACP methyl ester carboxylesterase